MKRVVACLLTIMLVMLIGPSVFAAEGENDFKQMLEAQFIDPDREYGSDVRWWLGDASLTDEVLLEEIQAMYDGGFHGVELCMQDDANAPNETYAYGSEMWSHKWKLMMNKLLDLGMEVSLTSGTNWATSNVPGLDPDSQNASQVLAMGTAVVAPGETVNILPQPEIMRESNVAQFIGAYAYKMINETAGTMGSPSWRVTEYVGHEVDYDSMIDLGEVTDFTQGATPYDQTIEWTAPADGEYIIYSYWMHGNYKISDPGQEICYATNYFDPRGVEALRGFWEANYLDDPELNAKIMDGDVQLFMDSIELTPDGGITWWAENMRDEFIARKGYDIMPYVFLVENLPQVNAVFNTYFDPAKGGNDLVDNENLREKIVNDWVDVLTQMYCENLLVPLKDWLNSVGIETRAQISYGRSFEITEPSMYVDYPEAENLNQYNQVDVLRLHTAGAKLQDKLLSTETGGTLGIYHATPQIRLDSIYPQYATGFQRVIWHIWSSPYAYGEENILWPGWGTERGFDRWGNREPSYNDMDEFNSHIGRVQSLVQTGNSRTDIGIIHNNWNQGMVSRKRGHVDSLGSMNWMLAHMGVFYRSTELQDNGYTYDYLSPDLLFDDDVYFNAETGTIELAGYKALLIYQDWLDPDGAARILDWAKQGLKVVVMENAAKRTPFNDGRDEELATVMEELTALDNVRVAEIYDAPNGFSYFDEAATAYSDGVYEAMRELGVDPYAGYPEANHQLLTQTRADEAGNEYLYVYNYCSNDYHDFSYNDEIKGEDHGTTISTEIEMSGIFVPYSIDAWTGETTELAEYRYEDGKTVIPISLDYKDIALYAFENVGEKKLHILSTTAESSYAQDGQMFVRATASGNYPVKLSDGRSVNVSFEEVPEAYDITNWNITVESWIPGDELDISTETIGDVETINSKVATDKEDINVTLETLTTWDNIPEIGQAVSGIGHYEATFNWDDAAADGAYLDFGEDFASSMKVWINGVKVGGDISQNPTKAPISIIEGYEAPEEYTGGIDWNEPCVDISGYLVDGENTIVIDCNTSLTNVSLSEGIEDGNRNADCWWNYDGDYKVYGPAQAVIVPFAEEVVG